MPGARQLRNTDQRELFLRGVRLAMGEAE
jgi:hypothetical protein